MKQKINVLVLFFCLISYSNSLFSQISLTASLGTTSGTYTTLKGAFDKINDGTHKGVITIQVTADCSESASPTLYQSGYGSVSSYTSVNIYPTGATRTISGNIDGLFLQLNGADNVTIDGRIGGSGSSNSLIIENTSTNSGACSIELVNDACSNYLQYLTIKGSGSISGLGIGTAVVCFYNAVAGGNDNNTLRYCTITKSGTNKPCAGFGSWGSSGNENSSNTITNNNFEDINGSNILINSYSTGFTITNNSIYQIASFAPSTGIYGIYINAGAGYTITGNYIGGQSANCGGNNYTLSSSAYEFHAIEFSSSVSVGSNTISSNTINNINFTTTYSGGTPFSGITTASNATYTVGSNGNGNIIGSATGSASSTDGITFVYNSNSIARSFAGFNIIGTGATTIAYNSVGGINISGTSTTGIVYLVRATTNMTLDITNNTFGNSANNNIYNNFNPQFFGIYSISTGTTNISNNIFQNITTSSSDSYTSGYPRNLTLIDLEPSSGSNTFNINNNTLTNIAGTYTSTNSTSVGGIHANPSSNTQTINIYKNKITAFTNSNTSTSSSVKAVFGIAIRTNSTSGATLNCYNNIVLFSTNGGSSVNGIINTVNGAGNTSNVFFNTVKLSGTISASAQAGSAAYYHTGTTAAFYVKNNIFQNLVTGGNGASSCMNYAQSYVTTFTTSSRIVDNYNETSSSSNLIYWGASTELNLANWRTAISDASNTENSGTITIDGNGVVANASGSDVLNTGVAIAITTDYEGTTRHATTPYRGAFERSSVIYYWNGANIASTPAAGGTGTWSTANSWRQPTSSGAQATWADNNVTVIAGTAGTITLSSSPTPASTTISTTGYTIATTGAARTLSGNISLGTSNITLAPTSTSYATLTLPGIISGSGTITQNGTGTSILSASNSYSGAVTVSAGALNLQNVNAAGTTAGGVTVSSGAELQLQGTIAIGAEALSLTGTGTSSTGALRNISDNNSWAGAITLAGATRINSDAGTLTLSGGISGTNTNITFGGSGNINITSSTIATGTGTLTKDGSGTLTISVGATVSSYTGRTTINAGKLELGTADAISKNNVDPFTLNGGTYSSGATIGYNEHVGVLTLSDNSTINFGTGSHDLVFGDSHGATWTAGKMITVTGWLGNWDGTSGTNGHLYFGSDATTLSADQLAQIQFYNGTVNYSATILANGEVVPLAPKSFVWDGSTDSDWKTASNWSANIVPTSSNDAIIPGRASYGTAPNINEADAVCASLTIQNTGTLYVSSGKLTISSLALNSGGAVSMSGGEIEMSGSLTWDGGITMTTGTLDVNTNITLSSTMTEAISGGTIECFGNFAGSADDGGFTPTGGTVNLNGSGSSTISLHSSANFYNLTIDCSGQTATLESAIAVSGALTISNGTLDVSASNYGISNSGNWANSGTFTPRSGTVTFNGTSSMSGSSTTSFYDLTISGTLTAPSGGTFNISHNWINTAGTFNHNNGTVVFNGTSTITTGGNSSGKAFYDLTLNGANATLAGNIDIDRHLTLTAGTWSTSASNYSMNLGGDLALTSGTFNANSSMVTFDGSSTQYINVTSTGSTTPKDADITLYDVTINGSDVRFYYNKSSNRYFYIRNFTVNNGKTVDFYGI